MAFDKKGIPAPRPDGFMEVISPTRNYETINAERVAASNKARQDLIESIRRRCAESLAAKKAATKGR
jgi:hypothetical protein